MSRWWRWMLGLALVPLLLLLVYDRVFAILWVGVTDLEIVFVVVDAGSGDPNEEALIDIRKVGDDTTDPGEKQFTLRTDAAGLSAHQRVSTLCSGKRSGLVPRPSASEGLGNPFRTNVHDGCPT